MGPPPENPFVIVGGVLLFVWLFGLICGHKSAKGQWQRQVSKLEAELNNTNEYYQTQLHQMQMRVSAQQRQTNNQVSHNHVHVDLAEVVERLGEFMQAKIGQSGQSSPKEMSVTQFLAQLPPRAVDYLSEVFNEQRRMPQGR